MNYRTLAGTCVSLVAASIVASAAIAQTARSERSEARRLERMQALNAEHFERTARIQDGDLDVTATISTEEGFRYRGGFTDRVRSDNFLRATVTKRTGATTIQLYQSIVYNDPARQFSAANYQSPAGLRTAPLTLISETVLACFGGLCSHREDVGFEVAEEDLRRIVAAYDAGDRRPWRFKFVAAAGEDWEDSISPAEIAGLLRRLDSFRSSRP